MKFSFLKVFFIGLLSSVAFSVQAQDLIARQAPIDRRLKSADSVVLQRIIEAEAFIEGIEIYNGHWDTKNVHCYGTIEVPDSFEVDLRGFSMPTPSRKVTSGYGYRRKFRRMHKGLDVKVYTGDTIYAAFDGKVRIVSYERDGYGKYIVLRHDNGLETIYGHLSKQLVKPDEEVVSGMPIGLGGNTGRSYGSHLHFETRVVGVPINPALLFDFANQDVTADAYLFRNPSKQKLAVNSKAGGEKTAKATGSRYYKVRKGDSLSLISKRTGVSVSRLCSNNKISTKTTLRIGQILKY